ncbi:MAG: S41 family peptidase [Armatimonadetes bacterium]|nr:S41 family peptidase [Armatimonadota bacterium]
MRYSSATRTTMAIIALVGAFALGAMAGRRVCLLPLGKGPFVGSADLLPSVLRQTTAPDVTAPSDLRPVATFWEVRQKIKENFVYPIKDETTLTYGAIRGMLEALDDPYSRFLTPEEYKEFQSESEAGQFSGIGAVLDRYRDPKSDEWVVVISAVLPGGPASRSNLRAGDVLLAVDGRPIGDMPLYKVVKLIRGPAGTKVVLTVRREGVNEPLDIEIVRGEVEEPVVEYEIVSGNIGYIWLRGFSRTAIAKMREALQYMVDHKVTGILLDLSQDPGGLLDAAVEIADMFIDKGPLVWIRERGSDPEPIMAHKETIVPKDMPILVLIDEASASASEILAGCLQDHGRAKVVGKHSFGKSKVQTVIELNDKSALVITTAVYLTPNKRDIGEEWAKGKRGIKPDIEFPEEKPDPHVSATELHERYKKRALEELKKVLANNSATGAG